MLRFDEAFRRELQGNWLPLATAFSCLLFGLSSSAFAAPFLFPEVIAEFGWSREQATLLASFKYAFASVSALIFGLVIDRIGVWLALSLLMTLAGAAMVMWIWIANLPMYYLSGAMTGIAVGGGGIALKVLVARSFHISHGTAMGIVLMGSATAGTLIPIIISLLISKLGWRYGFAAMSLSIWFIVIPFLIMGYRRSKKSPVMQASREPHETATAAATTGDQASLLARIRGTLGNRTFWIIALGGLIISAVDAAFFQHQVLILKDFNYSPAAVVSIVSVMGLISVGARLVSGNILDSSSNRGLAGLYIALFASCVIAPFLAFPLVLMSFVLLRAFGHAAVLLDTTVMTKHAFGNTKSLGMLYGFMAVLSNVGNAAGPWIMGRIFDVTGSYDLAYATLAGLTMAAVVLALNIHPAYWLAVNQKAKNRQAAVQAQTIPVEPRS
jgi:MFS family permease